MHCAHTIKMELGDLEGVESVAVDVEKKEVSVEYSAPATTKSIETLLAEINYPVDKAL
jgi:copper chaperone CopZ